MGKMKGIARGVRALRVVMEENEGGVGEGSCSWVSVRTHIRLVIIADRATPPALGLRDACHRSPVLVFDRSISHRR